MGWWGDDDNEKDNFTMNSTFKTSSTTRQCRPDPQDQNFLICKNIVKEISTINGKRNEETKEYEERVQNIPLQRQYITNNMEEELEQMFNNMSNNFFKGFPSIFFGPLQFEMPQRQQSTQQQAPQKPQYQQKKDDIYDC